MWKNLYQKTVYEAYKSKEHLGYKIFEFEEMFVVLWNDQQMFYWNIAHCNKFGKNELNFIKENIPNTFLCIASSNVIEKKLSILKKGTPSYLMMLNLSNKIETNKQFKILRVNNQKTLLDFCDITTKVYDIEKDKESLVSSFSKEINLDNCFKYVGYIDDNPAGTLEFSEGSEAAYVAWGAVKPEFRKRGLYKSMLIHAINHEIDRGFNKIVLNSSEMGKEIYAKMGFIPLAERNNYVLEKINE